MSIAEKRRDTEVFSMAFLDCICCGFGSVILIFILTIAVKKNIDQSTLDQMHQQIDKASKDIATSRAEAERIIQAMAAMQIEIDKVDAQTTQDQLKLSARDKEMALMLQQTGMLKDALNHLLGDKKELVTADHAPIPIPNIDRKQYLTGLNFSDKRILFLVRGSGSMLDETVELAAARLGDSDDKKRATPKWQRTVRSLEWMLAMLEPKTEFQVIFFNDDTHSVLEPKTDEWLKIDDKQTISDVVKSIEKWVPHGSANLERAFTTVRRMTERPDSIILITDGLPTSGDSFLTKGDTTVADRERLFEYANAVMVGKPRAPVTKIPIHTIMMPLAGDPSAAFLYWRLAVQTHGSFISPSKSWPDI